MMTPAEIFRELLKKDGKPDRQLKQYEAWGMIFGDPVQAYLNANRKRGSTSIDRWGTTILFPEDAPGPTPHVTEELKVCKDITRWREYVKAPDIETICSYEACKDHWDGHRAKCQEVRDAGKIPTILMGTGMFEQCHFLMGFEDTLTNFYEHPDEMHELIDYIFEYRMKYLKLVIDHMHPDAVLSHDDWGAKDSLFMQPDLWREFFKEPYRKFYKYMRDNDVIAIHHADSYLVPILEDMIEIGIQCWQGILPENDIPARIQQADGRIVLMGGIGAAIDRSDSTEEEITEYVKDVLETNCARGHFLPCITYGAPGTVFPHVDPVINRTIDEYNSIAHMPNYRPAKPAARVLEEATATTEVKMTVVVEDSPVLERLAEALENGQKRKVVKLVEEALEEGIGAQTILTEGLILGMTNLGDAFTANQVFVPEMLMAARSMAAATEILKPHLVGDGAKQIGRACIGTVKGDLHDIGKNLVKIMMEGRGIEVIDLGTDVAAETFVQTAIESDCDLIVCSSLLTTTMPEMKTVVELAVERGVREDVKILVGGAPVTQAFCDIIEADIYTDDAASAAKAAVISLGE